MLCKHSWPCRHSQTSSAIRGSGAEWSYLGAHVTQHFVPAAHMTPPTRRVCASLQAPRGPEPVYHRRFADGDLRQGQVKTFARSPRASGDGDFEGSRRLAYSAIILSYTLERLREPGSQGAGSSGRGTSQLGINSGNPCRPVASRRPPRGW